MAVKDTSKASPAAGSEDEDQVLANLGPGDALPPGTTLSDTYEIVEQVAAGGMAQVYRARNIHTDEPVAIKLVLPEFARDETIVALFKKEATILSRLHHDAIVHYHLFTVERRMKRPYLVMEFVDGVHLGDFYRNAPLNAESCRALMIRIASGLAAAHDAGVIHRDLSPDNVILPEGDVTKTKIIDFGIAKAAAVGEGTLLGGKFAGKYNFVSPEQLGLAGGEITERSDIYSLGLIAAAAMMGRPLDMSGSHVQVLDKRRVVPDLPGVDPSVRPAIEAMLQPLPENRPRNMRQVIELWANTTILSDDGKTVVAVDPWTTTPPRSMPPMQRSMPPQPSMPPQTSMPPQHSLPPQRSMPPQQEGTLLAANPWDTPNSQQTPSFGSTVVAEQSMPPLQRSLPPQQSQPPQPSMRSLPPLSGEPVQHSIPPSRSMPPQQAPATDLWSAPPPRTTPPQPANTGGAQSERNSESPFGPYVDTGPKFQLPPEKAQKVKRKGSPIGLIAAAAVVVVGGGLGLAFTQHWIGGAPSSEPATTGDSGTSKPGTTDTTPTKPADTVVAQGTTAPASAGGTGTYSGQGTAASGGTEVATATTEGGSSTPASDSGTAKPPAGAGTTSTTPAGQQSATAGSAAPATADSTSSDAGKTPAHTDTATTTVAQGTSAPADTGTSASTGGGDTTSAASDADAKPPAGSSDTANPQPATGGAETQVASLPNTPIPGLKGAAAQVAWLDAYPMGKCQYVHATQVADNSFGIEAYGDEAAPFQKLATDFQSANGVDPDLGLRLLRSAQCPVADFLTDLKTLPLAKPAAGGGSAVPKLVLFGDTLPNGGTLSGRVFYTGGWSTELLLVDYGGAIQNIDALMKPVGDDTLSVDFPSMSTPETDAVPIVLLAISSKGGPLPAAQLGQAYAAGAVLPNIAKAIKENPGKVAVSAAYFRIDPAKTASN